MAALKTADALEIPKSRSFKGLNAGAVVKFSLVAVIVMLVVPTLILPQRDDLTKLGNALCGESDAAYVLHMVWACTLGSHLWHIAFVQAAT